MAVSVLSSATVQIRAYTKNKEEGSGEEVGKERFIDSCFI
jgi:hypothetical protein